LSPLGCGSKPVHAAKMSARPALMIGASFIAT
jgi:hypothetical protein